MFEDQKEHLKKAEEIRADIFRKMSPEKKLKLSFELYHTARGLKAASLRQSNPDWTEQQVQDKVKEIFLYARS